MSCNMRSDGVILSHSSFDRKLSEQPTSEATSFKRNRLALQACRSMAPKWWGSRRDMPLQSLSNLRLPLVSEIFGLTANPGI